MRFYSKELFAKLELQEFKREYPMRYDVLGFGSLIDFFPYATLKKISVYLDQ
jgi:hypothetical protein